MAELLRVPLPIVDGFHPTSDRSQHSRSRPGARFRTPTKRVSGVHIMLERKLVRKLFPSVLNDIIEGPVEVRSRILNLTKRRMRQRGEVAKGRNALQREEVLALFTDASIIVEQRCESLIPAECIVGCHSTTNRCPQ